MTSKIHTGLKERGKVEVTTHKKIHDRYIIIDDRLFVVNATNDDLNEWLELATEVEYLFGPMVSDPKFIQAIEKNINQCNAFCVRENDGLPGSRLLGGVLFLSAGAPSYKIGWLAVSSRARNKGIATELLRHILKLVEVPAEVSVTTFGDDIPDGRPARNLYQKFGFVSQMESIPNGPEGGSRQKFKLIITQKSYANGKR